MFIEVFVEVKKFLVLLFFVFCFLAESVVCASAAVDTNMSGKVVDKIEYYPDPVYEKMVPEDGHPMEDMIALAKGGDLRAKFILADLYYKGKGGLKKDVKKAREYFEDAAIHGYSYSLLRLAAMEKKEDKPLEAWKWYTVAIRYYSEGEMRSYVLKRRGEISKKYNVSDSDFKKMTRAAKEWEDERDKILADEYKAAKAKSQNNQEDNIKDKAKVVEKIEPSIGKPSKADLIAEENLEEELVQEIAAMSLLGE